MFLLYKERGEKEWDSMKKGNLKRACGFKYLLAEIKLANGSVKK